MWSNILSSYSWFSTKNQDDQKSGFFAKNSITQQQGRIRKPFRIKNKARKLCSYFDKFFDKLKTQFFQTFFENQTSQFDQNIACNSSVSCLMKLCAIDFLSKKYFREFPTLQIRLRKNNFLKKILLMNSLSTYAKNNFKKTIRKKLCFGPTEVYKLQN